MGSLMGLHMKRTLTRFSQKKSCDRLAPVGLLRDQGFSLVEVCIALMVASIVVGVATMQVDPVMSSMKANKAMYQTVAQLRSGRNLAIAQRRSIQLRFLQDDQIQLVRRELPAGETPLNTLSLENKCQFLKFDSILDDTPDRFGNGSELDFANAAILTFLSDGTLVRESGDPVNGTIFLGRPVKRQPCK
jgi:prepilin-type N-terminal cleavage/methylation domain-containing protein